MSNAEPYLAQADHAIADAALDTIFRDARTLRQWQDKPVSHALLMAVYDLMRWGPTESNITPARFHFVVSKESKARLEPLLDEGNRAQTMSAPATAIVAYDLDFARTLPKLAPRATSLPETLAKDPDKARFMAMRSAGLQGGYFIVAARALGLDCGFCLLRLCGAASGAFQCEHRGGGQALFPRLAFACRRRVGHWLHLDCHGKRH
jgi:3-hydroxypropanoate dehydrogenase